MHVDKFAQSFKRQFLRVRTEEGQFPLTWHLISYSPPLALARKIMRVAGGRLKLEDCRGQRWTLIPVSLGSLGCLLLGHTLLQRGELASRKI
jgi:hypothetical protein